MHRHTSSVQLSATSIATCIGTDIFGTILKIQTVQKRFSKVQWKKMFPGVRSKAAAKGREVNFPFDLWDVNVAPLFQTIKREDQNKILFGHLPMMAIGSVGSIGAFLAPSFCERINSAANLVLTDGKFSSFA